LTNRENRKPGGFDKHGMPAGFTTLYECRTYVRYVGAGRGPGKRADKTTRRIRPKFQQSCRAVGQTWGPSSKRVERKTISKQRAKGLQAWPLPPSRRGNQPSRTKNQHLGPRTAGKEHKKATAEVWKNTETKKRKKINGR